MVIKVLSFGSLTLEKILIDVNLLIMGVVVPVVWFHSFLTLVKAMMKSGAISLVHDF